VRPKYVLKKDKQREAEENNQETPAIKTAPLPLMPLPRSNAGPSLLAELLLGKYMYHQPFHRQISMMKLTGMHLPASTVNGWFMGSCDLLRALYYRLKDLVFASDYIQVDESTVPVIDNEKTPYRQSLSLDGAFGNGKAGVFSLRQRVQVPKSHCRVIT
jgi:transposase